MVKNLVWILPRPRPDYYKGSFPLHFEKKLVKELGNPSLILHPFGGKSEIGLRVDLNKAVEPTVIADAHHLPFKDNVFDLVITDPPYSEKHSKNLYKTGIVRYKRYSEEAVRVCKVGGFFASYHWVMTPRPDKTGLFLRIFVGGRTWHRPRVCCVFQKVGEDDSSLESFIQR